MAEEPTTGDRDRGGLMTRRSFHGWGLALACVLGAVLAIGLVALAGGPVSAQDNTTNESDEVEEEISSGVADIDSSIRLVDYSYNEETESFAIVLENRGDSSVRVQLMEIIDLSSDRDSRLGMSSIRVSSGEEVEVSVSAELNDREAGVIVITEESLEAGEVFPITHSEPSPSFFSGGSEWSDVWSGVIASISFGAIGLVVGMWHIVAAKNEDVTEVPIR